MDDMWDRIQELMAEVSDLPPLPEKIRLTQEQIDQLPRSESCQPWGLPSLISIPIEKVDSWWESDPARWALEKARADLQAQYGIGRLW
jgi:hypothetical protein